MGNWLPTGPRQTKAGRISLQSLGHETVEIFSQDDLLTAWEVLPDTERRRDNEGNELFSDPRQCQVYNEGAF
jgi:hypothetical protein